MSGIFGNVIALIILIVGASVFTMLFIMTMTAALATLMFSYVMEIPSLPPSDSPSTGVPQQMLYDRLSLIGKVFHQHKTRCFAAYLFCQGFGVAYTFTKFPTLIGDDKIAIATIFLFYGISSCLSSYICGKLYQYLGWKVTLTTHVFVVIIHNVITLALLQEKAPTNRLVFILLATLLGVADNISNSLINSTVIKSYSGEAVISSVFAIYRFLFCVGFAFTSVLAGAVESVVMVVLYTAVMCVSALSLSIMLRE